MGFPRALEFLLLGLELSDPPFDFGALGADRSDRRDTCSGVKARKRKGSLKQILTREKLGLQIFGPCLGARETGGLSRYPWGVKF